LIEILGFFMLLWQKGSKLLKTYKGRNMVKFDKICSPDSFPPELVIHKGFCNANAAFEWI